MNPSQVSDYMFLYSRLIHRLISQVQSNGRSQVTVLMRQKQLETHRTYHMCSIDGTTTTGGGGGNTNRRTNDDGMGEPGGQTNGPTTTGGGGGVREHELTD